ncbi:MAG: Asp-tRNA(Asn)/Glu-tRNA(Gln) amidotransferase subunit GatB [bacterium]
MNYEPVIGLEIHIQLNTKSKMFCFCNNDIWKKLPNSVTCPTCLGLPGALPVPNESAIIKTQLLGLALNCSLNKNSYFARKNYFYPDLPKGYQITQYNEPFCVNGFLDTSFGKVAIRRIHLEEDTGKSMHTKEETLLDFNKSGVPLAELVTEPCIESAEQAIEFSKKIRELARFLGVSNGDMEKGNLRLELNISLREEGSKELPKYRVEIKNINSFKFLKSSIDYEIKRQTELLFSGEKIIQETRGWNEKIKKTVSQRTKEKEHDYRYFPEPDIPPFEFSDSYIDKLKKDLEKIVSVKVDSVPETSLNRPKKIKEKTEYSIIDEKVLIEIVEKVIKENPGPVLEYQAGKKEVLQFLMGCVMKETKGKADPKMCLTIFQKILLT